MMTEVDRVFGPENLPGYGIAVATCYGPNHTTAFLGGESDEAMQNILPNLYTHSVFHNELFISAKLESRPKEEKACSGDFVGAAVIHHEDVNTPPQTSIVLVQVDSLTDNGLGWAESINPDGATAIKIAEAFRNVKFLTGAHLLAQRMRHKGVVTKEMVRNTLVTQLSSRLIVPGGRGSVPSQRLRAIYGIWLGAPRYDREGTIDWMMVGSRADVEGYRGSISVRRDGAISFGRFIHARKILGNSEVDAIDQFAASAGMDPEESYKFKVGKSYDVLGPFTSEEVGRYEAQSGKVLGNTSVLMCSDGVRRNSAKIANNLTTGGIDLVREDKILTTSDKDDASYVFLNIGVY